MIKRLRVVVMVLLILFLGISLFFGCCYRQGPLETVYSDFLSDHPVDTIYFGSPNDRTTTYLLNQADLDSALEYVLSLEIRSAFPWERHLAVSADRSELDWITLVSNGSEPVDTERLRIIVVDLETLMIEIRQQKGHIYKLSEPLDLDYFLTFFDARPFEI